MSKPKTSLWGYSFITSLFFNPPFPMSVLFLKRPEVLEKSPTCFDIYSVTLKQEDIFYKFSKNVLTLHLYAIIFFSFDPFPLKKGGRHIWIALVVGHIAHTHKLMFR